MLEVLLLSALLASGFMQVMLVPILAWQPRMQGTTFVIITGSCGLYSRRLLTNSQSVWPCCSSHAWLSARWLDTRFGQAGTSSGRQRLLFFVTRPHTERAPYCPDAVLRASCSSVVHPTPTRFCAFTCESGTTVPSWMHE